MANRWPISSGNWSDTAIWSGSIKPTAADDVYANNQTVYVDENITVLTLRNASIAGVTLGGAFYINNAITASTTAANGLISQIASTPLVYVTGSNDARINSTMNTTTGIKIRMQDSATLTVSGTLYGGNTAAAYSVLHVSTGNLFITGNLTSGTNLNMPAVYMSGTGGTYILGNVTGNNGHTFENIGSGEIVITGNVTSGAIGANSRGIINSGTGNITVYGNATAITSTAMLNSNIGNLFISGTISGGFNNEAGISNTSTGNITAIGVISASTAVSNPGAGISNTGAATIQVTGSIVGGRANGITTTGDTYVSGSIFGGALGAGISTTSARTYIINGPIYAGTGGTGISSTSTTATNLFTGPFYNTGSFNAVYAYKMQMLSTASQWQFDTETTGVSKTLYTSNQLPGVPQQTDVRKGTQYNFGLTGSLKMPDPTVVKSGVAVDNTTGSAIFTPQDMFNVLTQDITQTGSIGSTLKNAATVQTTAATISAFKV